jgi:hypothetical protein
VDLNKLTLGDKIVAGTGLVLIISLLFFPWHSYSAPGVEFAGESFGGGSWSASAIESPNGFWGILAMLLTIAIVGVVLATKLGDVQLPELPIPWNDAKFYATIAVLVLLLLKLVIETDVLGWGCYLAILLAAGMVYGGFLIKQDASSAPSAPPSAF